MGKNNNSSWNFLHSPLVNSHISDVTKNILNNFDNNYIFFDLFSNVALTLFKWENLPRTMNADFLEWCLFTEGKVCATKNAVGDIVNLQFTEQEFDIYNQPKKITAYAEKISLERNKYDFVICKNNKLQTPTIVLVNYFCQKIKNIESTLDCNIYAQKMPVLFKGKKEKQKTLLNAFNKFNANQPYMFVDEDFTEDVKLETLTSDTKFIAKDLFDLKDRYKQEFYTFLGVNNANTVKAERLLTDEVNANNQFISLNFETMYKARLDFCNEFKRIFSIDIRVKPSIQSEILIQDKGGTIE